MAYKNKAVLTKKKRTKETVFAVLLGCVGCAALALAIYSAVTRRFIFMAAYILACIFSIIYTVIKINTIVPIFAADDEEYLYLNNWKNKFFPFKPDKGFLGEFMPDKVTLSKLRLSNIQKIYIGSGNFIARTLPESNFAKELKEYKKKFSGMLKRAEFIHITSNTDDEYFMPITDFDPEALANIIKDARHQNASLTFMTANRKIRRLVPENETKLKW